MRSKQRRNPDGDFFFLLATAGIGWYLWNKFSNAPAPVSANLPVLPPAGMAPNPANIQYSSTWAAGQGPNPAATTTYTVKDPNSSASAAAFYAANPTIPVAPAGAPPNPGDVLVSGYDAQGNAVIEWTGPGTQNPQAGEIAGTNPGLVQLAQYMGMTPAQTQAWIVSSQQKTGTTPPIIPAQA